MKLNYHSLCWVKYFLFSSTILLVACTKTILVESVPLESAGNPLKGDGANVTHSTVLAISSADPINAKEPKLKENPQQVHQHAGSMITKKQNQDSTTSVSILYACPMHPEVTSNNPKDLCPKCNMLINKVVKSDLNKLANPQVDSSHQHMNHAGTK